MKYNRIHNILIRFNFISITFYFVLITIFPATVKAVNTSVFGPYYREGLSCTITGQVSTNNSGIDSDGSIWNSGLQPPYILEQFAVETLKAVAKKRNVPETDTVTQEHIDALLAFMFGEGGDFNNRWLFNPLNSGLSSSELVDGAKAADGTQSFKSFDAGVEATARTIVGKNQSRLADILIKKDSTAQQFMFALTYFKLYEGNKMWAEASTGNPSKYYSERLSLVNQVRKNYKDIASTVIGTSAKEYPAKIRNAAALRNPGFDGASNTINVSAGSKSGEACNEGADILGATNGAVAKNITQTAINFSWPKRNVPPKSPKPEYAAAIKQFNAGQRADGADCGVFVATVMRASNSDPNYPGVYTKAQLDYVKSKPDLYDVKVGVSSTAELLPGDILIAFNDGIHHTFIYVGPQSQANNYDTASASLNKRTANLGSSGWEDLSKYTRARLK